MTREKRILLAEDKVSSGQMLQRRLQQAGYSVTWVRNYTQAKALFQSEHFHLAILDISLGSPRGKNMDGLRLLADLETFNLRGVMPTIVITAYERVDWILEAWLRQATRFLIRKDLDYISKLLTEVGSIFKEHIGINFDLKYIGNTENLIHQAAAHIYASEAEPGWLPREQLVLQMHDLIGKLFASATEILLRNLQTGLSGSVVLRAHPTFTAGLGQWFVLKIGTRKKTRTEEENYDKYVELYLPVNYATRLRSCYSRNLGALLYTLNTPDVEQASNLTDFYRQHSAEQVVQVLRHLFFDTCSLWYRNHQRPQYANVRNLYLEAFNLTVERIINEACSLVPDLVDQPCVRLEPCAEDLPNPLHRLKNEDAWWMAVAQCITHGDLNAGNILINQQGQCWLIDFYRTYPSHILRDVVVLETDLKFRVMDALNPAEFVRLEQNLVNLQPGSVLELDSTFSANARKAAEVLAGLRQIAWELLDCGRGACAADAQREYLMSLLMATLNVLRLRHFKEDPVLQPRRRDAFLSAALIAQKLDQLSLG
jgi:CheY-like chemotaxis protein